jgi:hypothetical protein
MHVLPADGLAADAFGIGARAGVAAALAGDPVPGAVVDAPEFLDVDGSRPSRPSLPIPTLVRIPETVESAIPSVSAISAAVIRSRRSAAIASIRRSSVRLATIAGAEERSSSPAGPSDR